MTVKDAISLVSKKIPTLTIKHSRKCKTLEVATSYTPTLYNGKYPQTVYLTYTIDLTTNLDTQIADIKKDMAYWKHVEKFFSRTKVA